MKNKFVIALLAAFIVALAVNASAQTPQVRADVPFRFVVAGKSLPAGKYTISSQPGSAFIRFDGPTGVHLIAMGFPDSGAGRSTNKLVFHRYGTQYFLSEIDRTDSSTVSRLVMTKAEKRARHDSREPIVVSMN